MKKKKQVSLTGEMKSALAVPIVIVNVRVAGATLSPNAVQLSQLKEIT
jgi:hypothetical protein